MKRIFILLLLFIPCIVVAKENVYIESIKEEDNNNVEIIKEPVIDGLSVNLDLKFHEVNSYIIYNVKIVNDSNEDYEIDDDIVNINTDYMSYDITCDSNNRIVKHKDNKTCYIKVMYANRIPSVVLKSGVVGEDSKLSMNLLNVKNPNTGDILVLVISILLFISLIILVVYKNKLGNISYVLIGLLLIIPVSIYAINKTKIIINTKVEIVDNMKQCSHEIKGFKSFIMCEIETDLYEYNKEKLEQLISNNASEEEILSQRQLVESYEEFIEKLDWDHSYYPIPNENNYKDVREGIYTKYNIFMPFIKDTTYQEAESIGMTKNDENTQLSDFHILKPGLATSKSDINDYTLVGEPTSTDSVDFEFAITVHTKNFDKNGIELEDAAVNSVFQWTLSKEGNEYIMDGVRVDQHTWSNTILDRKDPFLRELVDAYINYENILQNGLDPNGHYVYVYTCEIAYNYLNKGIENNYIHNTNENVLAGNYGYKLDKYFSAFPTYDRFLCNEWISNNKMKELSESLDDSYNTYLEYLDMLNNEYSQYFDKPIEQHRFNFDNYSVVWNGKFYTGKDAFFKFLADYYNIPVDGDVKYSVNKYLFERYTAFY